MYMFVEDVVCCVCVCCFFFLQAEDGIRDLVRSRGLGDVYKRQAWSCNDGHAAQSVCARAARREVAALPERPARLLRLSLIHI